MFKLTSQAQFVLLINIIQIIFYQLVAAFLPISTRDKLIMFVLILISMGIATFYMTYSVNCMMIGKCNLWAWIVAGILIVSIVYGMLSTTMSIKTYGQLYAMHFDDTLKLLSTGVQSQPAMYVKPAEKKEKFQAANYPEEYAMDMKVDY